VSRGWRALGALALLLSSAALAQTEPVQGRSRELGIAFELAGGSDWCRPTVTIQLAAADATAFQPEAVPFLQMIGRIRAIIEAQCKATERLIVAGYVARKPVFAAEMLRLTRWRRFVPLDPESLRPVCHSPARPEQDIECLKRIAAYATGTQLMQGEGFADYEITSAMEEREDLHLAWTTGRATGALKISHRSEFDHRYTSNAAFAEANLPAVEQACRDTGGQPSRLPPADHGETLSYRSVTCRAPGRPAMLNVLMVASEGDWFYLFSLWSEEPHLAAANDMAARLGRAIAGSR
jgi:hypothetical protein